METVLGAAVATVIELIVIALLLGWRPPWHRQPVRPVLSAVGHRRIGELAPGR
jgi:hypothetical protein